MPDQDGPPSRPDPSQTARMPAIQRDSGADDDYADAPPPPKPMRTPWVFLAGLLVGLLVIGGVYLVVSSGTDDDSAAPPSGSTSASGASGSEDDGPVESEEPEESSQAEANGSFGEPTDSEPPLGDDEYAESSGFPSMPSGQGGAVPGGGCKVSSMPKTTGGQIAQEVTITCAEPTSLEIEPQGAAVIEHDGEEHDSAFTVCADEVNFLVKGGGYSWDRSGSC